MNDPEELLSFWFDDSTAEDAELAPHLSRWFRRNPSFDRTIVGKFGAALERAERGELDAWKDTVRGRLALIILMDQVPRNAFRDSPRAFAFDCRAAQLCVEGLASGADNELLPIERLFFYLPLLHSERVADQERSVLCFARLAATAPTRQAPDFLEWQQVARRCRRVIVRFGRYPHRNSVLGRASTISERLFLLLGRLRASLGGKLRRMIRRRR